MYRITTKPHDGDRVYDADDLNQPTQFFGAWVAAAELGDPDYVEIRYDNDPDYVVAVVWRDLFKENG